MADGVTLPGTGVKVASDDLGAAGQAQLFKLAYSADGDGTLVLADANGLEVQLGAALPAGTALIGKVNLDPRTSGGLSIFRSIDLDETEEDVKTSAGQLYGYYIANLTSSPLYVKLYNATAANTTVGSTTPIMTLPIPPFSAANESFEHGVAFGTALCAACTTAVGDSDTGAPATNALVANFFYT